MSPSSVCDVHEAAPGHSSRLAHDAASAAQKDTTMKITVIKKATVNCQTQSFLLVDR